jgi:hypothetical protein
MWRGEVWYAFTKVVEEDLDCAFRTEESAQ